MVERRKERGSERGSERGCFLYVSSISLGHKNNSTSSPRQAPIEPRGATLHTYIHQSQTRAGTPATSHFSCRHHLGLTSCLGLPLPLPVHHTSVGRHLFPSVSAPGGVNMIAGKPSRGNHNKHRRCVESQRMDVSCADQQMIELPRSDELLASLLLVFG